MPNLERTADAISSTNGSFKPLFLVALTLAAIVYGCVFLWQPVGPELTGDEGEAISRGRYVLVSLLYPETRIATWFDSGRLPSSFSDRIPIAFWSSVWLVLSAVIGLPLVRPAFVSIRTWSSQIELLSTATLVGLALLSTATLVVGLMGGLKSAWPLSAAIAALAITVYGLPRLSKHSEPKEAEPKSSLTPNNPKTKSIDCFFFTAIVALTCCAAAITMLGAWLPPSEFDVLEYHLQAPKEFFQQGSIGFVPHNVYANMPLGIEMHSLAMMTFLGQEDGWLGGLIGKSITASFSLVGAALLGAFLARQFGALVGWCAAGLWLTSPGIAHVAMFGLIDGALAAYILASAVAISGVLKVLSDRKSAAVLNRDENNQSRRRLLTYWRIAGVTSGAAAAAKYPGLILAVLPVCAFFVWTAWQYKSVFQKREIILVASFIALELAATCGLWYGKNWALAGNPVYPLAANVFGGRTLTPEKIAQWNRAHALDSTSTTDTNANGINSISVNLVSTALLDAARLLLTSRFVQPAMILGILFCAIASYQLHHDPRFRLVAAWMVWSGWILLVWWFATHRIDRFWLPLTGFWAGLGAIGFWWLYQNVSPWLSQSLVVLGLVYGCVLISSPALADNRYFVSIAALRVDAGDENQVPKVFPTTAWVNQNLDNRNAKILLIGEARAFEFLARVEYSTCFDINPGEIYLRGRSRTEQLTTLRQRGITHILVLWAEIHRYRYPKNYGFSDWPRPSDIQKLVDEGVASRVDWGFSNSFAELLEVN